MRYTACAAILATCLAGAALAQEEISPPSAATEAPPPSFRPDLVRNPNAPGFRYMPPAAFERLTPGAVLMCCTPRADRTIDCRVVFEAPEGLGFAGAALALMAQMEITEESYAEYQATAQGHPFWQAQIYRFEGRPDPPPLPPRAERDALCRAAAAD